MNIEEMRAKFEAALMADRGSHGMLCDLRLNTDGEYFSACERSAWWAWQAAQTASAPQMDAARDAVAEALGDAYDCTRVWHAWSVGTMSQDDFSRVGDDADRINEIATAAVEAIGLRVAS